MLESVNLRKTCSKLHVRLLLWPKLPTYFDDVTIIENNRQVLVNIDATLVAIFRIDLSPKARHRTCWQTLSLWRHNQMTRQVVAHMWRHNGMTSKGPHGAPHALNLAKVCTTSDCDTIKIFLYATYIHRRNVSHVTGNDYLKILDHFVLFCSVCDRDHLCRTHIYP